jgi:hypothetical protein
MTNGQLVWITAIEMYFSEADEVMLKHMSEAWCKRGSYSVEDCSVTFTARKPIPAMRDKLTALLVAWEELAELHAKEAGCNFEFINLSVQLMNEADAESFQAVISH